MNMDSIPLTNPQFSINLASVQRMLHLSVFEKRQKTVDLVGNEAKLLFAYRGDVSVGNPAQKFSVLFDVSVRLNNR